MSKKERKNHCDTVFSLMSLYVSESESEKNSEFQSDKTFQWDYCVVAGSSGVCVLHVCACSGDVKREEKM